MLVKPKWTFLTNHAHILFLIHKKQSITIRQMAIQIGITERAVLRIIGELANDNYLSVKKEGRRNTYTINLEKQLRHNLEHHCSIEKLLNALSNNLI
ncbi:winged helix-turn-helix transcriptional regulator [Francisellaceae bacterium]|nr:winged helix-turn-helix transcriptional regulator [Francisellaceae bacterium]